ncbi:hypothetical protein HHI36_005298 [Cryptolaemus montrouzieri]|uniref:Uncharacterized protein n=1 Tax=Cryptolaemus montrouzieri TaxID=559131 RepID=A0ABD2NTZ3_9CUCU
MPPKECDPRCTGRCNKNRPPVNVPTINKGCDPRCTGRCSKKNVGTFTPPGGGFSPEQTGKFEEIPVDTPSRTEKENTGDIQSKLKGEITCIIVDLDGVILDIEKVYEWVITDLVLQYRIPKSEAQTIIDLQDEETCRKLCTDYKLSISPQDFMVEFRNISIKHLKNSPLMPGIEKLMEYFTKNGYPVALTSTSTEEAFLHKTHKHAQFFKQFSHIVLGGSDPEVVARKPSPSLYEVCGSRFPSKPDPRTILVLEDAPEGVTAGNKAGMNVVWFPNKYMTKEDGKEAVAILNSINEFNPTMFNMPPMK